MEGSVGSLGGCGLDQREPAKENYRSRNWKAGGTGREGGEEEEKPAVIYICVSGESDEYEWFRLENNDDVSHKPPICKCGAIEDLDDPVFGRPYKWRPHCSIAAVGPTIYVFGGQDLEKGFGVPCAEVSCIDTSCPSKGWKVCHNKMPEARDLAYPITLDDARVLLVSCDQTLAQMYNPYLDSWVVALGNHPPKHPLPYLVDGHAVVEEGGETVILMHGMGSSKLYSYNVNTASWGIHREFGFEDYLTGALVDGIYYVLSEEETPARLSFCGYEVSRLDHAERVQVKINFKEEHQGKKWVPSPGVKHNVHLLSLGHNKLAMVWHGLCFHVQDIRRLYVCWSIFEMTKEKPTNGGSLKLFAHPLSHVNYHVANKGYYFHRLVPVFSNRVRPKSTTRVPPNDGKVGRGKDKKNEIAKSSVWTVKQNKVAFTPIHLSTGKMVHRSLLNPFVKRVQANGNTPISSCGEMRFSRKLKELKEAPSTSGVTTDNKFECLRYGDEEEDEKK